MTEGGRTLATVSLAESSDGAALFQAVLAWSESFAQTAALLDRAVPKARSDGWPRRARSRASVLSRGALSLDLGSLAAQIGRLSRIVPSNPRVRSAPWRSRRTDAGCGRRSLGRRDGDPASASGP